MLWADGTMAVLVGERLGAQQFNGLVEAAVSVIRKVERRAPQLLESLARALSAGRPVPLGCTELFRPESGKTVDGAT